MEPLRRLIVTEAKASPNFRPIHVYLSKNIALNMNNNNTNSSSSATTAVINNYDNKLLDFLTFRGTDGNNRIDSASHGRIIPQFTNDHFQYHHHDNYNSPNNNSNNKPSSVKKNRIVFCDNSIFQNKSLSTLNAVAASPASPILSFVFPFSTLLLCRFQMAQPDDAVSAAFKVSCYSQLRQLSTMAITPSSSPSSSTPPPRICVLSPSAEFQLFLSSMNNNSSNTNINNKRASSLWNPPESLLMQNCMRGEGMFYSYCMPLMLLQAQRSFFNHSQNRDSIVVKKTKSDEENVTSASSKKKRSSSLVACVGSSHRQVQSQCLKMGLPCDSLMSIENTLGNEQQQNNNNNTKDGNNNDDDEDLGVVGNNNSNNSMMMNSGSSNFHHRKAADLCRRYVKKLKNMEEAQASSTNGSRRK